MQLNQYYEYTFLFQFLLDDPSVSLVPTIDNKSSLKLQKISEVVFKANPEKPSETIPTIIPRYSLQNLHPSTSTHPPVFTFYLIYLTAAIIHFFLILWDYASILENIKNVRNIPYYPRFFSIFVSANMAMVGAFLVGKWFLVAAIESMFILIDGTMVFLICGGSFDEYRKRWSYGWSGSKNPGRGFRDVFLNSLNINKTDQEVLEFIKETEALEKKNKEKKNKKTKKQKKKILEQEKAFNNSTDDLALVSSVELQLEQNLINDALDDETLIANSEAYFLEEKKKQEMQQEDGYFAWIFIGLTIPAICWILFICTYPQQLYWFNIVVLVYPLILWIVHIGNRKMLRVPLDIGSTTILFLNTLVLLLMMNVQNLEYSFILIMVGSLVCTKLKDLFNKHTGRTTDWELFDKEFDVLTPDERGFLEKHRCNTIDVKDILNEFIASGNFGEYESNFNNQLQDEDDEDEYYNEEIFIYKKNKNGKNEQGAVQERVQIEPLELKKVFNDIIADGKFLCSICLEQLYDVEILQEAIENTEVVELADDSSSNDNGSEETNQQIPKQGRVEVKDIKELKSKKQMEEVDEEDSSGQDRESRESKDDEIQVEKKQDYAISLSIKNSEELVHKTPCRHYFHKKCLEIWCEDNHNCPMCRKLIVTEFIYLNFDENGGYENN